MNERLSLFASLPLYIAESGQLETEASKAKDRNRITLLKSIRWPRMRAPVCVAARAQRQTRRAGQHRWRTTPKCDAESNRAELFSISNRSGLECGSERNDRLRRSE